MRFELVPNGREGWDIVDHKQEVLTIYNDLGNCYFSSAPQLCELLNDMEEETNRLKDTLYEAEMSYIYEKNDNSLDIERDIEWLDMEFKREYWND